jgi:hypothetical protein
MFADDLWMSRPSVDSDSDVLIVSNGQNVPIKESNEGQLRVLCNLNSRIVPIPSIDLPIYHDRRKIYAAKDNQNIWLVRSVRSERQGNLSCNQLIEKHALDLRKALRKSPTVIVIGIGNAKVSVEELPTCEPELRYRIVDGNCDTTR